MWTAADKAIISIRKHEQKQPRRHGETLVFMGFFVSFFFTFSITFSIICARSL